MTLREKILKTFVVTIREINTHGGPEKFFEDYPVGGLFYGEGRPLLDENGVEMGTFYSNEKLKECQKYSKKKLLVCADGCHLTGRTYWSSAKLSGDPDYEQDAYNMGKIIGMSFNDKGVDWVLGPCIDMCFDHTTEWGLTNDPIVTAKIYRQMIKGIRDQGVCATAKHFPGMGTSHLNMHMTPGQNTFNFDRWMETYGYTYLEMFKEDVDSVMTTHITLKSYDNEKHDGFYPIATFSEKITTELLKGKLGFEGAVVTDALIMGGMATGDLVAETVQAFKSGADLLLWPPVEAAEVIEEKILSGEIPMSRLEDALKRIERMENFRNKALETKSYDTPDPKFADEASKATIAKSICLLRNELDLLPLNSDKYKKVLIVNGTESEDSSSCNLLKTELEKHGIEADIERHIYDVPSNVCWQRDIDALQAKYDLVLFNIAANHGTWGTPLMLIWASHLFDKKKKVIIHYGSPYFAEDYFPEDPTYIEMNNSANEESARALVERLLGEKEFTGIPSMILDIL
ncbi:MAG: hypothetical protein E7672_08245 [Ruminococcaceae bacterium]|nr:hypothetical protein [Oscillospiraceae bacterium]